MLISSDQEEDLALESPVTKVEYGFDWFISRDIFSKFNNKSEKKPECFQYAATVALSYEEIKCNSERVSNIKPFYK